MRSQRRQNIINGAVVRIPSITRVVEGISRVAGYDLYNGTIRYVDGSNITGNANDSNTGLDPIFPKRTIASGYAVSSHNGQLVLLSNHDVANEPGGALIFNTADKGVLVRGYSSAITISQSNTTPNYSIRLGLSNLMQFADFTITNTTTKTLFSCLSNNVGASNTARFKFKNITYVVPNPSAASGVVFNPGSNLTTDTATKFYEWEGCTFVHTNNSGTFMPVNMAYNSTTTTFLFKGNNFSATGFTAFWHDDKNKSKVCVYDNTFNQAYGQLMVAFGANTALPDNTGMIVDVRNNTLICANGFDPHGFLFGRGTSSVYCVNNTIIIPTTSSANAIGMVIKTTAGSLGNSYFAGNYISAPEGILLKGAQYNDIQYNLSVINYSQNSGMTVYNTVESDAPTGIPCTGNRVRNNTLIGSTAGITISPTTATIKGKASLQTWDMDFNKYYGNGQVYIRDQQSPQTDYYLYNRSLFWTNNNDVKSEMLRSNKVNA